jgi:hypothetical protein
MLVILAARSVCVAARHGRHNASQRHGVQSVAGHDHEAGASLFDLRQSVHWARPHAQPFNDGRCCDDCNESAVVPALFLRIGAAEKKAKREDNGG